PVFRLGLSPRSGWSARAESAALLCSPPGPSAQAADRIPLLVHAGVHTAARLRPGLCTSLWTELVDTPGVSALGVARSGASAAPAGSPCTPKSAGACSLVAMSTTVLTALTGALAAAEGEGRELRELP